MIRFLKRMFRFADHTCPATGKPCPPSRALSVVIAISAYLAIGTLVGLFCHLVGTAAGRSPLKIPMWLFYSRAIAYWPLVVFYMIIKAGRP